MRSCGKAGKAAEGNALDALRCFPAGIVARGIALVPIAYLWSDCHSLISCNF